MKKPVLWLLLLLLALPIHAQAVSYEITDYRMEIEIQTDGAGYFKETIVYDFDSTHNGFLATIRHEDTTQMTGLELIADNTIPMQLVEALNGEPYTYAIELTNEGTAIQAYAPGGKGTRTLAIHYSMAGIAHRYQDTARLNRMLLSGGAEYKNATAQITLPGNNASEIQAFVHGGMQADRLDVSGGVVTLGPAPIAENSWLETDIIFPQQWLSSARTIELPMLESILAQEAEIERELAEQQQRAEERARAMATAILAAFAVYAIAAVVLFFIMKGKYGLRHAIRPVLDEGLLADMTAAEAQVLKEGAASASGMSATLLELVEAGALQMDASSMDTRFTLLDRRKTRAAHQSLLLDWLFATSDTFRTSQLDTEDAETAAAFTEKYNAWKGQVQKDVLANGWLFANRSVRSLCLVGVPCIGLALSFFLLRNGLWQIAVPGILLSLLTGFAFSRIRKRTDTGDAHLAAIDGFLLSYEDKLATSPESILSHTPLVMALGYLAPLADWLDANPTYTSSYDDPLFSYWMYSNWHHSMVNTDRSIREAQSNNARIVSESSSSSSSGGDISSGGSGGSSHGAW